MLNYLKCTIFVGLVALANTASAAPFQSSVLTIIDYVPLTNCDSTVAGTVVVLAECERNATINKPVLEAVDTHDLAKVEIQYYSNISLYAGIAGQDPDWQSTAPLDLSNPENLFAIANPDKALVQLLEYDGNACIGLFVDCRIDAEFIYSLAFQYEFLSGGLDFSSELYKMEGSLNCEDTDPVGIVGFGTCSASRTEKVEEIYFETELTGSDTANFVAEPVQFKGREDGVSILYDATDDLFRMGIRPLLYFEVNVIYTYVDKPVVPVDDPQISAVPLPAGLPLVLTGLMGFAGLRLRTKRVAQV